MATECYNQLGFGFQPKLVVDFAGGTLTTDAGLLLVREFDEQLRLSADVVSRITDTRDSRYITHDLDALVRQRLYQIAAGYEDVNDADRLRHDPTFQVVAADGRTALGSQPTLSRLENAIDWAAIQRLARTGVDWFCAYAYGPNEHPADLILDLDSTDDPTHGTQQLALFHGWYDQHMYHPLVWFEGRTGLLLRTRLRPGRDGTSDFAGAMDDNPGIAITADRTHALGNLGPRGGVLLRNRGDLGPPAFPNTRVYRMTDVATGDVRIFDRNLQVPYAQTWTAGWQRKVSQNMAVEARCVGTRHHQGWITYNYNEINIVENGFLDEFRRAQQNLQANVAAGRGADFRYFGPGTGTSPLPVYLAYFAGRADAGNSAAYSSSLFANSTFVNHLAMFNPQPNVAANALDADATRRANALRAGLPANFLVANPDLLGGAEVTGNGEYSKFNGLQLELRKRLSHGL